MRYRQGGHIVSNRMGHAVLLDGNPLGDGDEATWFTGVHLQPTGGTLLRLAVVERPVGVEPDGGVIPLPPEVGADQARKKRIRDLIALAVVAVGFLGVAARSHFQADPPTPGEVLHAQLRPALVQTFPDGRGEQLAEVLRNGLVYLSKKGGTAAWQKCQEARRLIAELTGRGESAARALVAELEADIGG